MSEREQIPRLSLVWLLITQAAILAPHVAHLPLWLLPVWLVVVLWRWQIFRGSWGFPRWPVKFALVCLVSIGLVVTYVGSFGVETMIGLLVVGFILKLLEMKRRRDLLLVCYLGYFVAGTQFLFYSNALAAFYGFFSLALVTAAILAANQSVRNYRFWRTFRLTGVMFLQALPLMLVLFMLVPRIGAMWSVPAASGGAQTGVSDTMSPGDFSNLMESNEVAFRVTFDGEIPAHRELYWRGMVFSEFDGRQWSRASQERSGAFQSALDEPSPWREAVAYEGRDLSYQVMLEATNERWLYSLTAPRAWEGDIKISPAQSLRRARPVHQRIRYEVTSTLDYTYGLEMRDWQRAQALSLGGDDHNPETRRRAEQWLDEAGSPEALIQRLLSHFNERFRYTLQPPALGRHTVDEFLWDTQAGFCEHYASAFVFFLRAAGIPARVVVGYQGGDINPHEEYLLVRQRNAHAWAEVWLADRGWVRMDPTAAVAPERIERGLDSSLDERDTRMISMPFGGQWLTQLQLRWDVFNYQWHMLVMGYDSTQQERFLRRFLGGVEPWRIASALLVLGGVSVLLVLGLMLWGQRRRYRYTADRYYERFAARLARAGWPRRTGEAPRDYARRVAAAHPEQAGDIERITQLYERASYADDDAAEGLLQEAVKRFRVG